MSFEEVIKATAREMGLEPDEAFVHNVVALRWAVGAEQAWARQAVRNAVPHLPCCRASCSELLAIRHCIFLLGPTGCGRSEVIRVLARAISAGCDAPSNPYLQANNRKKVGGQKMALHGQSASAPR